MRRIAPLLILAAACQSDPTLVVGGDPHDLDDEDEDESGDAGDTGEDGEGGSGGGSDGGLDVAWSVTDFGIATFLNVGQLDWGPDGSLVVGTTIDDRRGHPNYRPRGRIDRFAADGSLLWTTEIAFDEFAGDLPVPEESATINLFDKAVRLASIDHTADGTILVAFSVGVQYANHANGFIMESTRNYIRSYDAGGVLLAQFSLGGLTEFPVDDNVDQLFEINGARALPDGSIVWSGSTSPGLHPEDQDRLITEGSVGRLSPEGEPVWTLVLGQELDRPGQVSPPEETALDAQPTPDGGIAIRGHYVGNLTVGDNLSAYAERWGTYVARLDLDGVPTWLATAGESEPVGVWGQFPLLGIDGAGHVFTASDFFADGTNKLIEVRPDGEIVETTTVNEVTTLSVEGDRIVLGNRDQHDVGGETVFGAAIELRAADGSLVDTVSFNAQQPDSDSSVFITAASPDGRIAVGGTFQGAIDFGDGPFAEDPHPDLEIQAWVAVLELAGVAGADD